MAVPAKQDALRRAAWEIVDGVHIEAAFEALGFRADRYKIQVATHTPEFQSALRAAMHARLQLGAPLALDILRRAMVGGEDAPNKTAVMAAKTWLDRAGYVAPKAAESPDKPKQDVRELGTESLRQLLEQAERELASRARPIEGSAPSGAQSTAQALDFLD